MQATPGSVMPRAGARATPAPSVPDHLAFDGPSHYMSIFGIPLILYFFALAAVPVLRYNFLYFKQVRKLERSLANTGARWSYWRDYSFRLKMFADPSSAQLPTNELTVGKELESLKS